MSLFPQPPPDRGAVPELAPFQREAVARIECMLARHSGALLADEPGLGKSWVAAEIMRRFSARGVGVELIAPASLLTQWTGLLSQFGVEAARLTHDSLARKTEIPAPRRGTLLVVDEAHRFRNPATQRYLALARRMSGNPVLLVTATPFCNTSRDVHTLIRLLVPDDAIRTRGVESVDGAFESGDGSAIEAILDELVVRRSQSVLPASLRFGILARAAVRYQLLDDGEVPFADALGRLRFPLAPDSATRGLLASLLQRRLESSRAALRGTLTRLRRVYARARDTLRSGRVVTGASYRRVFGDPGESLFQELLFPEFWRLDEAPSGLDPAALDGEIASIDAAVACLGPDRKPDALESILNERRGRAGIVFTASIETARDLHGRFAGALRCALVSGRESVGLSGMRAPMDEVLAELDTGKLDLLVATDLGSEGLNLQSASFVVHYDLPWSPSKLEQRAGRIHRIGQRRGEVESILFLPDDRTVSSVLGRKTRARRLLITGCTECNAADERTLDWLENESPGFEAVTAPEGVARLVETIGANEAGRFCTVVEGDIVDGSREAVELLRALPVARRRLDARAGCVRFREAIEMREFRFVSRLALPGHVRRGSPQARLAAAAQLAGAAGGRLVAALGMRYRAGTEMLIADVAAGPLDRDRLERLIDLLHAERRPERELDYRVRVVGAIVPERTPESPL